VSFLVMTVMECRGLSVPFQQLTLADVVWISKAAWRWREHVLIAGSLYRRL
jgi:hypothetical protein